MNRHGLFNVWAPPHGLWTPWVKPVLFAAVNVVRPGDAQEVSALDAEWAPPMRDGVAVVLDLPGAEGVEVGMALAERGYRPVPLYNAWPGPGGVMSREAAAAGAQAGTLLSQRGALPISLIDVKPIMEALCESTGRLAALKLPIDAPPAFLIDADRLRGRGAPLVGRFDNRWITGPRDFPSAFYLLGHDIRRVLIAQRQGSAPQEDLLETLLGWREAGLEIDVKSTEHDGAAMPLERASGPSKQNGGRVEPGLVRNRHGGYGGLRS